MNIVLLGGTGYIGRHICEAFEKKNVGIIVTSFNPDYQFLNKYAPLSYALKYGTDETEEALAKAEYILHFGHQSRPGSNISSEVSEIDHNIRPAMQLFSRLAYKEGDVHIIYASTGGQIYGLGHTRPITEQAESQPITPYAFGKHLIEESLRYYERNNLLSSTILRIGNPVGYWQLGGRHGFVSAAVEAAILRRRLTLYGEGQNVRDYFDVRDLADFIVKLVLNDIRHQGTFNIGTGVGKTENEVLSLVQEVLGIDIDLSYMPARAFDLPYAVLDISRARAELEWFPSITLEETIEELSFGVKKVVL